MNTKLSISAQAATPSTATRKAKHQGLRFLGGFAFLATATCGSITSQINAAEPDAVLAWNEIMQTTVAAGSATAQARAGAIVQVAVFEAVNTIVGDYEPYLGTIVAPEGASAEAAAIAAAHRTLVAMFPANTLALDGSKAFSLAAIQDGAAKDAGIAVGEAAAIAVLQRRANDGAANAQNVPYTPGNNPGDWQPSLPALAPASQPGWGLVVPFALESGAQFRLPPPPPLESGRYARDYDEVKLVGRVDSALRPADRTDVARFYAASSPTQVWNSAARQVSLSQGRTLSENARIFGLLNIAMMDASIATYETKYFYNLWRPITAIRGAAADGNEKTDPDGNWTPLITTPAFPSYASGHATLSGAARTVCDRVFGNHGHTIKLTSSRVPGVELDYTDFKQVCDDIDDARIYGGIHFRFDQEAGARQGKDVGHFILDNYMRSPLEEVVEEE